jgi:hypothetical protein
LGAVTKTNKGEEGTAMSKIGTALSLGLWIEYSTAVQKALPRNVSIDVARACESKGELLGEVLAEAMIAFEQRLATSSIPSPGKLVVDLDADPFLPEDWQKVERHSKGGKVTIANRAGQLYLNDQLVELYLSESQKDGLTIKGHDLGRELKAKSVLNASVLDFLLAHSNLIPESWKGQFVFFWGTEYCDADGNPGVRFLRWSDGRWFWGFCWLVLRWAAYYPAALVVSPLKS